MLFCRRASLFSVNIARMVSAGSEVGAVASAANSVVVSETCPAVFMSTSRTLRRESAVHSHKLKEGEITSNVMTAPFPSSVDTAPWTSFRILRKIFIRGCFLGGDDRSSAFCFTSYGCICTCFVRMPDDITCDASSFVALGANDVAVPRIDLLQSITSRVKTALKVRSSKTSL